MRLFSSLATTLLTGLLLSSIPVSVFAQGPKPAGENFDGKLSDARDGFATTLTAKKQTAVSPPAPPKHFRLVRFPAPLGAYPAYLTEMPATGKRYPAIVWLSGGFDNGIGDSPWRPAKPANDQSARAFREAGVITMYPSLRGANGNPGYNETFYGEVDDVLAALKYLAAQPEVDPARIYLGGHSTGGTLALLAAEIGGTPIRAVFAFGPVAAVANYGKVNLNFDYTSRQEMLVRSPVFFLNSLKIPTFILEGAVNPTNSVASHLMGRFCTNPGVHIYDLPGLNHFSDLAPTTQIIARKILLDTGDQSNISFADAPASFVPVHS